jgi:hypothetical protein
LRRHPDYRHVYNERTAEPFVAPPSVCPEPRKHVRDANGKWPPNPMTDEWIATALGPDTHEYPINIKDNVDQNPNADRNCELGLFHMKLNGLCAQHSISTAGRNELISLLVENTSLELGVRRHPRTNNIIHTSDEYLPRDSRAWFVDVCVNQCMLYVGEFEHCIKCPVCDTYRYTKCNYGGKCPQGINCNPHDNPTHKYRSSLQVLTYR